MPHSVLFFLEMVATKFWDRTTLLHNKKVKHVIAGVPLDYLSQESKASHLSSSVGWTTLGFPEYSTKWPHDKYTIGFSNNGPTFYINTMDNTHHHGPGGQGHHLLKEDGEPCFGKVVQGKEVVDALVKHGLTTDAHLMETDLTGEHLLADDEHKWTQIVSVEFAP
jgi:cyclophilin family peptidyl-prolyl cis-trans isomerase